MNTHLIQAAVSYYAYDRPPTRTPDRMTTGETLDHMAHILWHEAHECMKTPLDTCPDDATRHIVDLNTSEPGIVASNRPQQITRVADPVPIQYPPLSAMDAADAANYGCTVRMSPKRAVRNAQKRAATSLRRLQRKALKDIEKDAAVVERRRLREEERGRRAAETKEERAQRLEQRRVERQRRDEEASEKASDNEARGDDAPKQRRRTEPKTPGPLEASHLIEKAVVADCDRVLPRLQRVRNAKTQFYPNPVPHDRHLTALQHACPTGAVEDAVVHNVASDAVQLVFGPPGTGKSHTLCDLIAKTSFRRAFVCAPTNVTALGLYTRLMGSDVASDCSLCICPQRIPPEYPVACDDPQGRIVCSTISGRAGPLLTAQSFDLVVVDEAAQCTEALFWTLLRSDVRRVILAGDSCQLPALVSESGRRAGHDTSVVERMVARGYENTLFLTRQYRMTPEIVKFPNWLSYDNKLQTARSTVSPSGSYRCYKVLGSEEHLGASTFNASEADVVRQLVLKLLEKTKDVVVITPYAAQCRHILAMQLNVQVHTVDSFQGREADAVVLSMVRTRDCEFWNKKRVTVALTRAKNHMYVVGSFLWDTAPLSELRRDAVDRGCLDESFAPT